MLRHTSKTPGEPQSLHTLWGSRNDVPTNASPALDTLLKILKTRFRVCTVMIVIVEKGSAVLRVHVGSDPLQLDGHKALAMCQNQAAQQLVIEHIPCPIAKESGQQAVRFYAGAPLAIKLSGQAGGMLFLLGAKPAGFSAADRVLLGSLANMVSAMLLMPHKPAAAKAIALMAQTSTLLLSADHNIEAVNERFTKLTQFDVQDLLRTSLDNLLCLDRPNSGSMLISHALLAEVMALGNTRCHTKTGSTLPVEVFVVPLSDRNGQVVNTLLLIAPLFAGPVEDFLLSLPSAERNEILSLHIAGLWSVDTLGRIGRLSGAPVAHLNATELEAISGQRLDKVNAFDNEQTDWKAFYQSIAERNLPDEVECCVSHNGHTQWYSMVGFKQYDARGKEMGYHGSFRDITRRKLKESALRKSEERQRLILKGTNDGAWDWDMETGGFYLSSQWWEMMGRDPNEHLPSAEMWMKFLHPDDRQVASTNFKTAVTQGSDSFQTEFRMQHLDGHYIPVLGRGHILRNAQGKPIRTSGTNQDLSARKAAEQKLHDTTQSLTLALEASELGMWTTDFIRGESFHDRRWNSMLGYPDEHRTAAIDGWHKLVHPDDLAAVREKQAAAHHAGHDTFEKEFRMRHSAGHWVWIQSRGRVTERDREGKPLALAGTHLDVTAKVEARMLSEKMNAQLSRCLEHLHVRVVLQREGTIRFVNSTLLRIFGAQHRDDIIGTQFSAYVLPDDLKASMWRQQQLMAGAAVPPFWFHCIHQDGSVFRALTSSTVIEWEGERHILSTLVPPSDAALMAEELEKSRTHFESVLANQVEKEQVRISQELHDSLGSQLAGISLQAAGIKRLGHDGQPLDEAIDQLLTNIRVASEITRDLARGLAPVDAWPGSFRRVLEKLCLDFSQIEGLICEFEMRGDFDAVSPQVGNHLYRIAQEAIANALRHGAAKHIVVSLTRAQNEMAMTICDDGAGFEIRAVTDENRKGLGLSSMYARANAIQAQITFERVKPKGFCVSVNWTAAAEL